MDQKPAFGLMICGHHLEILNSSPGGPSCYSQSLQRALNRARELAFPASSQVVFPMEQRKGPPRPLPPLPHQSQSQARAWKGTRVAASIIFVTAVIVLCFTVFGLSTFNVLMKPFRYPQ